MSIYCEGLCRNNGTKFAKAGYAIVFGLQDPRNVSMRLDGAQTTQRADLAAISHLVTLLLQDNTPTTTYSVSTHSKWLVSTVNENLDNWKRAGWTNQAREKVENLDLLQQLDKLLTQLGQQGKSVHMEFVRMQEASPAHVLADKLANAGCDLQQGPVIASQLSPPQSPQERRRRSSTGFPPPQQQSPGHQNQYGGYPGPGFYGNVSPQQQQQQYYQQQQHHQQQQYHQQYDSGHYQEGYPSPQWQHQQSQQQHQEWR
jgi:ribonuclease HI